MKVRQYQLSLTGSWSVITLLSRLESYYFSERKRLTSLAVFRVIVGLAIAFDIVINWSARKIMWYPNGLNPLSISSRESFIDVSLIFGSAFTTDAFLVLMFLVSCVFAAGWGGIIVRVLFMTCLVLLYQRSGVLLHGGDNLLMVLAPMIVWCKLDGALRLRGDVTAGIVRQLRQSIPLNAQRLMHNAGVMYGIIQLCVLYSLSVGYKLLGESWRDGTAFYQVSRIPQFNVWPELTNFLGANLVFVMVVTYLSVLTQLLLPVSIFVPWLRLINTPVLIAMHVGIAVMMGLPTFSLIMIAADTLVMSEREWQVIRGWRNGLFRSKKRQQAER